MDNIGQRMEGNQGWKKGYSEGKERIKQHGGAGVVEVLGSLRQSRADQHSLC